jgi:hypothetical protein
MTAFHCAPADLTRVIYTPFPPSSYMLHSSATINVSTPKLPVTSSLSTAQPIAAGTGVVPALITAAGLGKHALISDLHTLQQQAMVVLGPLIPPSTSYMDLSSWAVANMCPHPVCSPHNPSYLGQRGLTSMPQL